MIALYPKEGALALAAAIRTLMAVSFVKLFKNDIPITVDTTAADLAAAEADYDGYVPKTVTAYNPPYLDPQGGATTSSGYEQFDYGPVGTPPVTNNILGLWGEDAGGKAIIIFKFDAPIPMNEIGDSVPASILLNFGR